ncbi:hypothetical protein G7046_g1920 [Stylonectria norvegica]|nr:hypothetical protein G7046_g1920 [Stylonectria norvegica]
MESLWKCAIAGLGLLSLAHASLDRRVQNGMPLRLMPLGDSITSGWKSSDGNGYRKDLRDLLKWDGNAVTMVGSHDDGTMVDDVNSGWPGLRISQVQDRSEAAIKKWLPNVVTLHVGTNDCVQNWDIAHAGGRIEVLMEYIWETSPGVTIILATLIKNGDVHKDERIWKVNKQIVALAKKKRALGKRVILVDMQSAGGPLKSDLVDQTHPDDIGYEKMAKLWFKGIQDAGTKNWIVKPLSLADDPPSSSSSSISAAQRSLAIPYSSIVKAQSTLTGDIAESTSTTDANTVKSPSNTRDNPSSATPPSRTASKTEKSGQPETSSALPSTTNSRAPSATSSFGSVWTVILALGFSVAFLA